MGFFFNPALCCRPTRSALACISKSAAFSSRILYYASRYSTSAQSLENTTVEHSRFLAEASSGAKWKGSSGLSGKQDRIDNTNGDFDRITEGKGKLSPTSSHLFKLILPLGHLSFPSNRQMNPESKEAIIKPPPPIVILLHPSQPLSHVSRLILASLAPETPTISFRSISSQGQQFQWSDSTDVGDFIRDAARAAKFSICITQATSSQQPSPKSSEAGSHDGDQDQSNDLETSIDIEVPTFADRTRFLRRRLSLAEKKRQMMEGLKRECDHEARRGARRMELAGFGMLVVYWGAVARLTFWDYGWDVMEPITYLSSLSTVICGYLWFLYQGREVSYASVRDRSISARREALYKSRGLDIERWMDLVSEAKSLRKEIGKIAEDYDQDSKAENEREHEDSEEEGERKREREQ